jgi:hypothetical protein
VLTVAKNPKKPTKKLEKAEKEHAVMIKVFDVLKDLDDIYIYFTDDFKIEGNFVSFIPKGRFDNFGSHPTPEKELILPITRIFEIKILK